MNSDDLDLALGVLVGEAGIYLQDKPRTHPLFKSVEEASKILAIVKKTSLDVAETGFLVKKLNQTKAMIASGKI